MKLKTFLWVRLVLCRAYLTILQYYQYRWAIKVCLRLKITQMKMLVKLMQRFYSQITQNLLKIINKKTMKDLLKHHKI